MVLQLLKKENQEDYYYLRENKSEQYPHIMNVEQTHPTDIYADDTHEGKMPLGVQLYIGGLSILGLYMVYKIIRKSSSKYI
jgi:hypothetical protein